VDGSLFHIDILNLEARVARDQHLLLHLVVGFGADVTHDSFHLFRHRDDHQGGTLFVLLGEGLSDAARARSGGEIVQVDDLTNVVDVQIQQLIRVADTTVENTREALFSVYDAF
jgi:hypothetical protein